MPDPIDQNTPPAATSPNLPDPQAMVDAALSPTPEAPASTTTEPVTPPAPPAAPAPSMPAMPPMPEPVTPVTPSPAPEPVMPVMPAPTATTVAMGDDTPLAFVTPPPSTGASTTTAEPVKPVDMAAPLPPVPPAPAEPEKPKKKGKGKIFAMLLGFLALLGVGGYGGYWYYFDYRVVPLVAPVTEINGHEVVGPESCSGCDGGHEVVWRNGACVQRARLCGGEDEGEATSGNQAECTGCRGGYNVHWNGSACINGTPCNVSNLNSDTSCNTNGGDWCSGTDARGQSYAFCAPRNGEACYQHAIDAGYTIQIGSFSGKCICDDSTCKLTDESRAQYAPYDNANYADANGDTPLDKADKLCADGKGTLNFGTAKYICRVGVKGYTGSGECTDLNGVLFTGNQLGCFCGTVQVDTGSGHMSYSSTCGCDKSPNESSPPTITTNPTMACTGLTQAPAAPVMGGKVTFTCSGTITPTTAGTLSYKFRYSLNNAAATTLANKTATTAELTIAACGEYKVECQTCATIAGVLKCDPNWVGATQ